VFLVKETNVIPGDAFAFWHVHCPPYSADNTQCQFATLSARQDDDPNGESKECLALDFETESSIDGYDESRVTFPVGVCQAANGELAQRLVPGVSPSAFWKIGTNACRWFVAKIFDDARCQHMRYAKIVANAGRLVGRTGCYKQDECQVDGAPGSDAGGSGTGKVTGGGGEEREGGSETWKQGQPRKFEWKVDRAQRKKRRPNNLQSKRRLFFTS